MEITGSIIAVLPERSGTSAKGEWKCASYVIETQEQYPKKVCFDVFGADKIAQFAIQQGEYLTVSFDIDAHEYQGKYYNSVRAWNVARPQAAPQLQIPQQPQSHWGGAHASVAAVSTNFPPPPPTGASAAPNTDADQLPF